MRRAWTRSQRSALSLIVAILWVTAGPLLTREATPVACVTAAAHACACAPSPNGASSCCCASPEDGGKALSCRMTCDGAPDVAALTLVTLPRASHPPKLALPSAVLTLHHPVAPRFRLRTTPIPSPDPPPRVSA
jgi:hypothetical protein